MKEQQIKMWLTRAAGGIVIGVAAVISWFTYYANDENAGLASGNGRIAAVEVAIAAKTSGRVKDILVHEGDFVKNGQVLAVMDTESLDAQLRQAKAQLKQAQSGVAIAHSQLSQRQADKATALAVLEQREAELNVARKRQKRSSTLVRRGAGSQQDADNDIAQVQSAAAVVNAAHAQIAATEAAITTAEAQLIGSESSVEEAKAAVARIRADINDATLKSPCDCRVQYRIAQPGEIVSPGGRVLNLIDLTDVYMNFFLPTTAVGKLKMGQEVRLVLDAAPQYVIPAKVSYVADVAQFTPKTVETEDEREKLMFRVKARIDPALIKQHMLSVKTGLPGMAYVRIDKNVPWPDRLALTPLPQ